MKRGVNNMALEIAPSSYVLSPYHWYYGHGDHSGF